MVGMILHLVDGHVRHDFPQIPAIRFVGVLLRGSCENGECWKGALVLPLGLVAFAWNGHTSCGYGMSS